jgi:hypothetical protein
MKTPLVESYAEMICGEVGREQVCGEQVCGEVGGELRGECGCRVEGTILEGEVEE